MAVRYASARVARTRQPMTRNPGTGNGRMARKANASLTSKVRLGNVNGSRNAGTDRIFLTRDDPRGSLEG